LGGSIKRPQLLPLLIAAVALLALMTAPVHLGVSVPVSTAASMRKLRPSQAFFFEQNVGQADRSAQFIAHGAQYDLLMSGSGMVFKLKEGHGGAEQEPADDRAVAMGFEGGSVAPKVEGDGRQPAVINYYVGTDPSRWHSGVPTFARVHYQNVYPGVNLVYYAENDRLEFDFQVAPGSDPGQIRLRTAGAYTLSQDGDLILGSQSQMRIRKPRAYQMVDGQEREVVANYVATDGQLGLNVGEYDRARALTIDPVVLYAGYVPVTGQGTLGGPTTVAVDAAGNAYLLSASGKGCAVTKLSSTGALVYQTTFGAAAVFVWCNGIAADAQGNTYITGATQGGIPTTSGVVQPNYAGNTDAFAAKLTNTGQLVYGTYLGGSGNDQGFGVAVDTNGNAYLAGSTSSNDFPLDHAFQSNLKGGQDAFVSVLNPTASAFVYSTYLGGSGTDSGSGIGVDGTGEAYVTGLTTSTDFPLINPLQSSCGNPCGAPFLTKFNSSGSALVYSTYLNLYAGGGSMASAIAVDQNGNALVAATVPPGNGTVDFWDVSAAGALNFSNSLSALAGTLGVGVDAAGNLYIGAGSGLSLGEAPPAVVASYTNSGTLIDSIQIYGITITGVAGAGAGNVYIGGEPSESSTGEPFFLVNTTQPPGGALIASISAQNSPALGYSASSLAFGFQPVGVTSPPQTLTLEDLGSATLDLNSIVVTGPGFAPGNSTCTTTLAAWTFCSYSVTFTPVNGNLATGAITITDNSLGSPHVIQLTGQGAIPVATVNPTSLSFPDTIVGQSSSPQAVTLTNTGHATLSISRISISGDFSETNTCGPSLNAGQNCSINVTFTPTALGTRNGMVTIADNASNSPQTIPLSGTGVNGSLNLNPAAGGSTSATVQAGQAAAYQLSIGGGGFSGMASLSCSGAPTGASCSLPSSINVNAATATPFGVSVTTTSRTMSMLHPGNRRSRWLWATNLLCLMILPLGMGKKPLVYVGRGLPILLLLLICSCGGGSGSASNPNGTPSGTYPLTVTAKSGSSTQSIMLTLKVE
jgi:hypothetical protein